MSTSLSDQANEFCALFEAYLAKMGANIIYSKAADGRILGRGTSGNMNIQHHVIMAAQDFGSVKERSASKLAEATVEKLGKNIEFARCAAIEDIGSITSYFVEKEAVCLRAVKSYAIGESDEYLRFDVVASKSD